MSLSRHKVDKKAAADGTWFKYLGGDLRLRLAYTGARENPAFANARRKADKQMRGGRRGQYEPTEDDLLEYIAPVFARHAVLDWDNGKRGKERGLPQFDGEPPMECTPENVMRVFQEWPQDVFLQAVVDAGSREAFEVREEDMGNSGTASNGS